MATDVYDEILKRARQELSVEEQMRLARDLVQRDLQASNGENERTLFDAMNARGLIGFMKDGPIDLSTNPIHLEGFGANGE